MKHDVSFTAVVRDKQRIVERIKQHQQTKDPSYRYKPEQLYDRCIGQLFRDRLHKDDAYIIEFAKRYNKPRTDALRTQIEHARRNFYNRFGTMGTAPIEIKCVSSKESTCLQVADYFLWALQRIYERNEDRYWNVVREKVGLVHDVDDTRAKEYGRYYDKRNPLSLHAIKKEPGI